jgi:transcriptional regulator with XRE-family HTH domain
VPTGILWSVDDMRVGAALRAIRKRRGWRQADVAAKVGVSRSLVATVELGHLDTVSLRTLRRLTAALDVRLDLQPRWRGGELDRLLNSRHSALHESVARFFGTLPAWAFEPEVSFSIYGERGVVDILAWHAATRSLLVIELKTLIVDVQALVGDVDRKRRLAKRIASEHGWDALTVSSWVIVAKDATNQRRAAAHRTMLRAALPTDGRTMRGWLLKPTGAVRSLSLWTEDRPTATRKR